MTDDDTTDRATADDIAADGRVQATTEAEPPHGAADQPRHVPGIGGPGATEDAPDGRAALRLHAGISAIGGLLSVFVTLLFFILFGNVVLGVVFAVVAIASFAWGAWALWRLRSVAPTSRHRAG